MPKILMVEDNKDIVEILKPYFDSEGFNVDYAYDGKMAIEKFEKIYYDLILLDIMLPYSDGLSLCEKFIKEKDSKVIMLTARSHENDIKRSLELGAIDYIMKPFVPSHVISKMKAFLLTNNKKLVFYDKFKLDLESKSIYSEDELVSLSKKESSLLFLMLLEPNVVHTRESLIEKVWQDDHDYESRSLDTLIKRIRKKLLIYDVNFEIKTIWGVGYKIEKIEKWHKSKVSFFNRSNYFIYYFFYFINTINPV